MKNPKAGILCLLLTFFSIASFSQTIPVNEPNYNKPRLFQDQPDRLAIRISLFESLLNKQLGETVNVTIAPNFVLNGIVVSKSDTKNMSVKSVVVKTANRQGAGLTFTQIKNADGSNKYLGRIISPQHGDGYEIVAENGQYYLVKKGFYDLVNE